MRDGCEGSMNFDGEATLLTQRASYGREIAAGPYSFCDIAHFKVCGIAL
jgi:hypothetical protein